ncbi:hypothetical protein BT93_F2322 [Corymbia citriodora subsp. variegata]|nr:hypothetical protein BT93_F2322 [Corymbia citriodora subsp. variegata]
MLQIFLVNINKNQVKIFTSESYQDANKSAIRPHPCFLANFTPHIFHLSLSSMCALLRTCRNDHGDKTTATTRQLHFVIRRDYFYALSFTKNLPDRNCLYVEH